MKFLIALAATAMSALLLTPTLAPSEMDAASQAPQVAEAARGAEALRG